MSHTNRNNPRTKGWSDRPDHQLERGERFGNLRSQMALLKVKDRRTLRRVSKHMDLEYVS